MAAIENNPNAPICDMSSYDEVSKFDDNMRALEEGKSSGEDLTDLPEEMAAAAKETQDAQTMEDAKNVKTTGHVIAGTATAVGACFGPVGLAVGGVIAGVAEAACQITAASMENSVDQSTALDSAAATSQGAGNVATSSLELQDTIAENGDAVADAGEGLGEAADALGR